MMGKITRCAVLAAIPAMGTAAIASPVMAGPVDPLLEAINALREGDAAYSRQEGEDDGAIEATYGPPFRTLSEWDQPATSMAGVREAVRLAVEHGDICCPAAEAALIAALAYLDAQA